MKRYKSKRDWLKWRKKIQEEGLRTERDLAYRLRALGFKVDRVPTSASGPKDFPEVIARKGMTGYLINAHMV